MGSTDTMKLMGDAFVELAEQRPLEKISVSDIVAASGKNRKTFYYHFEGKSHLIRWVFRSDLAHMLQNRFEGARLVYEEDREGPMAELPYYAFKKVGIRSLDGSDFLRTLSDTFQNRRSYYAKALRSDEPDGLRAYLHELYTPALANDIRFILSNRSLDEANVRFLAEFYTGALVSYMTNRLNDPSVQDVFSDIEPFENIIHDSIEHEIKEQQFKRVL